MDSKLKKVLDQIQTVVLGKEEQCKLAVACILGKGHLLIEDLPGMGKTTLAHVLAKSLGLSYNRVQFTADMLPADILGVSIFDKNTGEFVFKPGPIFAQLVLADEINRATPKTQSALLEAMEERQVTAEGETRKLPEPFFVIATQNPSTQMGTYPLPESQLDRFLMRIELGYPDPAAERMLVKGEDRREMLDKVQPSLSHEDLFYMQKKVQEIHVSESLLDYVERLVQKSRRTSEFTFGLSPRGMMALVSSAKAWAYIEGRDHVVPEDVQIVLPAVAEHRLRGNFASSGSQGETMANLLLSDVEVVA